MDGTSLVNIKLWTMLDNTIGIEVDVELIRNIIKMMFGIDMEYKDVCSYISKEVEIEYKTNNYEDDDKYDKQIFKRIFNMDFNQISDSFKKLIDNSSEPQEIYLDLDKDNADDYIKLENKYNNKVITIKENYISLDITQEDGQIQIEDVDGVKLFEEPQNKDCLNYDNFIEFIQLKYNCDKNIKINKKRSPIFIDETNFNSEISNSVRPIFLITFYQIKDVIDGSKKKFKKRSKKSKKKSKKKFKKRSKKKFKKRSKKRSKKKSI